MEVAMVQHDVTSHGSYFTCEAQVTHTAPSRFTCRRLTCAAFEKGHLSGYRFCAQHSHRPRGCRQSSRPSISISYIPSAHDPCRCRRRCLDGSSLGRRSPPAGNMVLGDADMHAVVDGGDGADERPGPVPHGDSVPAILQLQSRLYQVTGWLSLRRCFPSHGPANG